MISKNERMHRKPLGKLETISQIRDIIIILNIQEQIFRETKVKQ